MGCIYGELASLRPLFPGSSDVDQLFRIVQVLGSPTPARWPVRKSMRINTSAKHLICSSHLYKHYAYVHNL